MAEHEVFETRLRAALARHVADAPPDIDALAFARAVAAAAPRRQGRAGAIAAALDAWRAGRQSWWSVLVPPAGRSPALRMAWILAVAGLLLAAMVSAVYVGSELLRRRSELNVVPAVPLTITAHPEGVAAVAWSPDGLHLATASRAIEDRGGTAKVWDVATGDELLTFTTGDFATTVATLGYSPDGTRIAIGGPANAVYDAATGDKLFDLADFFLAYSPDGSRIGVGGAWGGAAVVDAATGDEQFALPLAPSWMSAMAWSPDGTRIATAWGTNIKVWDAATGVEQLTIDGLVKMTDLAWSPDGTRIAAAKSIGQVNVYDATTGEKLASSPGQTAIDWSPDGTRLAMIAVDGTVQIWDAGTGEKPVTLDATRVTDVAWSPDGTRVAIASDDGTARVRRAPTVAEEQPAASPVPTEDEDPRALEPVGEPIVADTALGTITWRVYEGYLGEMVGTPHGPVATDGAELLWLGPDGTVERASLPEEAWGLFPVGDGLIAYNSAQGYGHGQAWPISWDGTRWVIGDALDVPPIVRPVEQVAAGPRGTIVFGEVDFAIARDGRHFVVAARPPVGLDPVEPFVLATADGFVALVTPDQSKWDFGAFEPVPWFTVDGETWEPASAASPFGEQAWINSVAGHDGRFVAVGHVGSSQGVWAAWVSDDGLAWERLAELGDLRAVRRGSDGSPFVGESAGDAGWVIYSKDGSAWASADGRAWEPLGDWPRVRGMGWIPPEVALAGDTIVGVGYLAGHDGSVVVVGTIEPFGP